MENQLNNRKLFLASLLIIVGSVLMLKNLELVNVDIINQIFTFKLIFVLIAISSFLKEKYISAIVFTIMSVYFYFPSLFLNMHIKNVGQLWPLILIAVGINKILKSQKAVV